MSKLPLGNYKIVRNILLYQGSYADLWMELNTVDDGSTPTYFITEHSTMIPVDIEGTKWKDLRDVMDSLKIYEYEKMEEAI